MEEILLKIGLTRGESKVYTTLLKTGNTTSGELIKKSGVSRSKVYDVLERLKQKGLVTEMIKKDTKHFEATNPERILELLDSQKKDLELKEEEAKKAIPKLVKLQNSHLEKQETKIYMGIEGWKALYSEILATLNPGEEYLAFGIGPEESKSPKVQDFFRKFHLKRAEKKIPARIIMSPKTKTLMKQKFSDLKYYKYRFSDTKFPTSISIFKDHIVTLVWDHNPVAFLIKSKQVADKYRLYFEEVWKS